jgi:site-specific DNA recombinase
MTTEATGLRVLARVRLSHMTVESTSVERQQEIIRKWADTHGHVIVGWAIDTDVSRSVNPFDAPELGPWLNDPEKSQQWDVVACWKLDRVAIGAIYLADMIKWCNDHKKVLISVTENFDLSHWIGRLVASVIAGVAEGEWSLIQERTLSSRDKLRKLGRWGGGTPVYGLQAVPKEDGVGFRVVPDPETYPHLRIMIEMVLSGKSLNSVAAHFNREGIYSPQDHKRAKAGKPVRGTQWRTNTITSVLTSPTLLGHIAHDGEVVHGDDGMPIRVGEPVVTRSEWKSLQERLVEKIIPRTRTQNVSLLLDVAYCPHCQAKLYRQRAVKRGTEYIYYRCANVTGATKKCTQGKSIKAAQLEEIVANTLMRKIGNVEIRRKVLIPGEDHTAQLTEAREALSDLMIFAGAAKSATARTLYAQQMTALDERIAHLESLPHRPDQWKEEGTGVTYAEKWAESTDEERRQLLIDSKITVYAGWFEDRVAVGIAADDKTIEAAFPGSEESTVAPRPDEPGYVGTWPTHRPKRI